MPKKRTPTTWFRRIRQRYLAQRLVDDPTANGDELDTLAQALDLSKLTPEQFTQLLKTLHMLGEAGAGVHLNTLSTDSLVRLVSRASKDQLKSLADDEILRPFFLDEIFRRMSHQLIREKVRDVNIVVSWRFTNGDGEDGYDRYQTLIEDGDFTAAKDLDRIPDTTVTVSVYDFILMATGNAAFASMFVTGKVKIKGDYSVAAMLTSYFDIPKPVA